MVELKNVSVTYQTTGIQALNNISLKVNDGEFAFVVGSSGAGKSTLIKLLLKEIDATSGVVTVNGYNLTNLKRRRVPEFRRTIGVVFQDFRLIETMTVYENIAFVLRVIDAPRKYIRKRVPYVISLVGLQDKASSYPRELYGGEPQQITLQFAANMANIVFDRFGRDRILTPTPAGFTITVEVVPSPQFFAWLTGLGTSVQVLSPQPVARQFQAHLRSVLALYG